ncbi:MAG: 5'-methylthioadenosine/S-adenosylhomocysteine nucleosidase [Actinomycetota bacterium]|nr:5'-methylthioadenosine/S-adenosylhomocysteine nucleosidase [Actinomycetota bacterium]
MPDMDALMTRILDVLGNSTEPLSGRQVSVHVHASPTTANAALRRLKEFGGVTNITRGRSTLWSTTSQAPALLRGSAPAPSERVERAIVIVTALQLEHLAMHQYLLNTHTIRSATGVRFTKGGLLGKHIDWRIFLTQVEMGNVSTASMIAQAVESLSADFVVFVGTAAGLKPEDQQIGDVIVASKVYNAHAGKQVEREGASMMLTRPSSYTTTVGLAHLTRSVIANSDWNPGRPRRRGVPKAALAAIASVEAVQANPAGELVALIRSHYNDAAALDMESFGLYAGAHLHGVPALAVRGISDHIEGKTAAADADRQPIAARNAAALLAKILEDADPDDVPRGVTDSPTPSPAPIAAADPLPPHAQPWVGRLRRASAERADKATAELPKHVGDSTPLATWLNRALHRPPRWLREDETGDGWALVAAVASVAGASKAAQAHQRAAAAADTWGDPTMGAVHRMWAAMESNTRENGETIADGQAHIAEALRGLDAGTTDLLSSLIEFYIAAASSDINAMATHAPAALASTGQDPTQIGLPAAEHVEVLDVEDDVRALLACGVLMSMATAWLLPGSRPNSGGDIALSETGAQTGLSVHPGNPMTNDNAHAALAAARRAAALMPTAGRPKLLAAQAEMAVLLGGLTRRPDHSDTTARLRRIELMALDVRDARRQWGGHSAPALALAARARAQQGDPVGALRMLLPAPDGFATAEEARDDDVRRIAAVTAVSVGRNELAVDLCAQLPDQAEAALIRAAAYRDKPGMARDAERAYRSALEQSENRTDIVTRALFGLARSGVSLTGGGVDSLKGYLDHVRAGHEQTADLIEATAALADGRPADVLRLVRQYPDSEIATGIRVNALLADGRAAEAVDLLDDHGIERGDVLLRVDAMMTAGRAELDEKAEKIATELMAVADGEVRRQALEAKLHLARRGCRWTEMVGYAESLLKEQSQAHEEGKPDELTGTGGTKARTDELRWLLAEALYFQDKFDDAADALLMPQLLPFRSRRQVQLLLAITRGMANSSATKTVNPAMFDAVVSAASDWLHDEEIAAQALGVLVTVPVRDLTESQIMRVRQFSEQFFTDHADDRAFTRIDVGDDMSELFTFLKNQYEPREKAMLELTNKMRLGQIPQAFAAAAANRSYAESLIKQLLDCYITCGGDEDTVLGPKAVEGALAAQRVVIDTSALVVGPKTGIKRATLIAQFDKVLLPYSLRDDVRRARSSLALRSSVMMGWNSREQRPTVIEHDAATVEQWATDADALHEDLRLLTLAPDPEDPQLETWNAALLLAKENGLALWADDLALRSAARAFDVAAFSTLDLLNAAQEHITFNPEQVVATLVDNRVVDLPLPENWASVADDQGWKHNSYLAISIARPFAWRDLHAAFNGYRDLIRNRPGDADFHDVAQWAANAASGLAWRTPPPGRAKAVGSLLAWTALNSDPIFDSYLTRGQPIEQDSLAQIPGAGRHLQALLRVGDELRQTMFEFGDALEHIVTALAHAFRAGMDQATTGRVMATVIGTLDSDYRGRALEAFLATPPSEDIAP